MFSGAHDIPVNQDGNVFLDRDGATFLSLINFLRNNRKQFPQFDCKEDETLFINELEFWGFKKDLKNYKKELAQHGERVDRPGGKKGKEAKLTREKRAVKDSSPSKSPEKTSYSEEEDDISEMERTDAKPDQKKHKDFPILPYLLVEMMETLPKNASAVVQQKWKQLGSLDLAHLVKQLPQYTSSQNFGKSEFAENLWGLLDKGEPSLVSGIGRHIFASGTVYEGMYRSDKRDGQGRLIWNDGAYYVGQWKKDKRNGKGCFFHANGDMEQGEWKDGKLVLEHQIYKMAELQPKLSTPPTEKSGSRKT